MARALLRAGADPNAVNEYGVTPLELAATNGSERMITALLPAGARPDAALPNGQTPLMTAARTGTVAAVNALLSAGAAVDAAHASKGQTALMWAIAQHHRAVTRVLIAHGADVGARTTSGFTPLLFAAREGDLETARLLLANGVEVNASADDGVTPLLAATARGHVDLALFFLAHGARPDGSLAVLGYTPLHWAVTTFEDQPGHLSRHSATGRMGGDERHPGPGGQARAHQGAAGARRGRERAHDQAVAGASAARWRLLLVPPRCGRHAVFCRRGVGRRRGHAAARRPRCGPAGQVPRPAQTPLMIATAADKDILYRRAEPKRLQAVQLAWELGNDLEAADHGGHRALHLAARSGYHDIITFLVEHGAGFEPRRRSRGRTTAEGRSRHKRRWPWSKARSTSCSTSGRRPPSSSRTFGARSEGKYEPDRAAKATAGPDDHNDDHHQE